MFLLQKKKRNSVFCAKTEMVQVGMYLKNQNIKDEAFKELYKKRAECEKMHGNIKDTVKFDIRRVRKGSRKLLYSLLNSNCISNIAAYGIAKQSSKQKFIWRIFLKKKILKLDLRFLNLI